MADQGSKRLLLDWATHSGPATLQRPTYWGAFGSESPRVRPRIQEACDFALPYLLGCLGRRIPPWETKNPRGFGWTGRHSGPATLQRPTYWGALGGGPYVVDQGTKKLRLDWATHSGLATLQRPTLEGARARAVVAPKIVRGGTQWAIGSRRCPVDCIVDARSYRLVSTVTPGTC